MTNEHNTNENMLLYELISDHYDFLYLEESITTWKTGIFSVLQNNNVSVNSYLDFGCGTGAGAQVLSSLHPEKNIGVDISHKMTKAARSHYSYVVTCDINSLPFHDLFYDCAVCGFDGINHLKNSEVDALLESLKRTRVCRYLCFDFISSISCDWLSKTKGAISLTDRHLLTTHNIFSKGMHCELFLNHFPLEPEALIGFANRQGIKVLSLTPLHNVTPYHVPGQFVALLKIL